MGHLHDTRLQLEEYTKNLEVKVAQRTEALENSQRQLQEKITARNQELHTLNTIAELITRSVNLTDISAPGNGSDLKADTGPGSGRVPAARQSHSP